MDIFPYSGVSCQRLTMSYRSEREGRMGEGEN